MVGDAGVGGGGLGVEIGIAVGAEAEFDVAVASSSHESATVTGFVRTFGACDSGEMVSLSRDDCNAEAEADVEVIVAVLLLLRGIEMCLMILVSMQCGKDYCRAQVRR